MDRIIRQHQSRRQVMATFLVVFLGDIGRVYDLVRTAPDATFVRCLNIVQFALLRFIAPSSEAPAPPPQGPRRGPPSAYWRVAGGIGHPTDGRCTQGPSAPQECTPSPRRSIPGGCKITPLARGAEDESVSVKPAPYDHGLRRRKTNDAGGRRGPPGENEYVRTGRGGTPPGGKRGS